MVYLTKSLVEDSLKSYSTFALQKLLTFCRQKNGNCLHIKRLKISNIVNACSKETHTVFVFNFSELDQLVQ